MSLLKKIAQVMRLAYRIPLGLIWTLGVHFFLVRLPGLLLPKKRFTNAINIWGKGLAVLMGVKIHTTGKKPKNMGDIIIANHMGFLDVPILLSFFPAVFIIKMEMRNVLFAGGALAKQGHVFVARENKQSRYEARAGIEKVLSDNDRIIVFPEGGASPGITRKPFKPFSFILSKKMNKTVQLCVIDYLPNRDLLKWDVNKPMAPQLISLLAKPRIDVSITFFEPEIIDIPTEKAAQYHDICEKILTENTN